MNSSILNPSSPSYLVYSLDRLAECILNNGLRCLQFIILFIFFLFFSSSSFAQGSGNAISLDGTGEAINLGNSVGNGTRTIEIWFKPSVTIDDTNSEIQTLIARDFNSGNGASTNEFALCFNKTTWGNAGRLSFRRWVGSETHLIFSDSNEWIADHWYHVAATIDESDGMKMYINGVLQQDIDPSTDAIGVASDLISIGKWGSLGIRYFNGEIDEMRLWSSSRSQEDVRENMCKKLNGLDGDLSSYYNFDGPNANSVQNLGTLGVSGTMLNMDISNKILSGAPIGNESALLYSDNGLAGQSLLLAGLNGEIVTIEDMMTPAIGAHIYRVDDMPSSVTNLGDTPSSTYFGVFLTSISGQYNLTYDLNLAECSCLDIYTRDNNSTVSWSSLSNNPTNCSFDLIAESSIENTYRGEYILEPSSAGTINVTTTSPGCIGLPVYYQLETSVPPDEVVSIAWDFGNMIFSDLANPIIEYSDEGLNSYAVSVAFSDGCTKTAIGTVVIFDIPEDPDLPETVILCNDESFTLDFSDFNAWDSIVGPSGDLVEEFTFTDPNTYAFSFYAACSNFEYEIEISSGLANSNLLSASGNEICLGNTVDFAIANWDALDSNSGLSLDFGDGAQALDVTSATLTHTYSAAGNYLVSLNGDALGCPIANNLSIEVMEPLPFEIPDQFNICSDDEVTIDLMSFDFEIFDQNSAIVEFFQSATAGFYTLSASNSCGQIDETFEIIVTPFEPRAILNFPLLCPGGSPVEIGFTTEDYFFNWSTGANSARILADRAGVYSVIVNDPSGNCEETFSYKVEEKARSIEPIFNSSEIYLCAEQVGNITPNNLGYPYLLPDSSFGYSFAPEVSGVYILSYSDDCYNYDDQIEVIIEPCLCPLFVPNGFTPNGDGLNDIFKAKTDCQPVRFELLIFNRWGQNIFSSNNIDRGWNGESPNDQYYASESVYYYIINYTQHLRELDIPNSLTGHVTLIR